MPIRPSDTQRESESKRLEREALTLERAEALRKRRRMVERAALGATLAFLSGVGVLAWYTDGRVFDHPIQVLQAMGGSQYQQSRNAAVNCKDPRNKNTPYCQQRDARSAAEWAAMSRVQGGKVSPFSLTKSGERARYGQ